MKKIAIFLIAFTCSINCFADQAVSSDYAKKCEQIEFGEIKALNKNELVNHYCRNNRILKAAEKTAKSSSAKASLASVLGSKISEKTNGSLAKSSNEIVDSCNVVNTLFRAIRREDENFSDIQCLVKLEPTAISTTALTSVGSPFERGEMMLSYSLFGHDNSGGNELKVLHDQGSWDILVAKVQSKQSVQDIYYYYLGRAAEAYGYSTAAEQYFLRAINVKQVEKCGFSPTSCEGLIFPKSAQERLQMVSLGRD